MATATREEAREARKEETKDDSKKANGKDREKELEASKEAVMAAYENLVEAKEHFKQAMEAAGLDFKHEAEERLELGKEKARELGEQATHFANERPLASIGIAFAAGFILSQLFRR